MSTWEKLLNINRRIVYLVLLIVISYPLFRPVGFPLRVNPYTQSIYDYIESLRPGSVVAVAFDYSPDSFSEINPQAVAVMNHVMRKPGIKVLCLAFWTDGPIFCEQILDTIDTHGKVYGEDYVHLGFVAGGENAMSAFGADIHKTFPVDYRGNPIGNLPMMDNVKTAKDLAIYIAVSSGSQVPEYCRQIQGPYKVPFASGLPAIAVPMYMPFVQSKQMMGFLTGLRGAAEYETLLDMKGAGTVGMDAIAFSHLVVMAFIIVANVAFFASRKEGAR